MSYLNPLRRVTVHNDPSNPIPVDIGAIGSIDVNVTNASLDTNITNASIPITSASTLDTNITNASIPVTSAATLDTNITNASIPITSAVDLGVSINNDDYFPLLIDGALAKQTYYMMQGRGLGIGATEQTLAPTSDTEPYQWITTAAGVPCSAVCDGADATCMVWVEYYANSTTSTVTNGIFPVNGTTPVDFTANLYRIKDFQVFPFSPSQPDQSCYLYITSEGQTGGIPDGAYLDYLYIPTGKSEVAMYYSPPNVMTVLESVIFMSDQGDADKYKITVHAYLGSVTTKMDYQNNFYMGPGIQQTFRPFIKLPSGGSDMEITVQRVAGAGSQDISIIANMIQYLV